MTEATTPNGKTPRELRELAVQGAHSARGNKRARTSAVIGGSDAPSAYNQVKGLFDAYAPLGNMLPWEALDYIELLARYNPDFSQAVDNVRTLANSGHELFVEGSGVRTTRRIKNLLESKARTIQESHGGVDGLIDKLLDQAATFGAMCGEWVLNEELTDVVDFADINPKTIRFFWDETEQRYIPFQKVSAPAAEEAKRRGQEVRNNCVRLNEVTFRYFAFGAAPGSPYGTPPFVAALGNIAIQRDMVHNMSQIVKKVGLLGIIDLVIESLPPKPNESDEEYAARAGNYLDQYAAVVEEMVRDGGIVHFDDVAVETTNVSGNAAGATNIFKQNEEQVFSGLKSMPSVQGRCLDPDTRITMADGTIKLLKSIEVGDLIQAFDEQTSSSRRRWRTAKVENVWEVEKESLRLHLSDGRTVVCSEDHPFLMQDQKVDKPGWSSNKRSRLGKEAAERRWHGVDLSEDITYQQGWKRAGHIEVGEWIRALNEPIEVDYDSADYKRGYLAGANSGDGCYRESGDKYGYWQIGVEFKDDAIIDRCEQFIRELGVVEPMARNTFKPKPNPNWPPYDPALFTVLKTSRKNVLPALIDTHEERDSVEYKAGWLAGLIDTDGSCLLNGKNKNKQVVRIHQNPGEVKDQAKRYLSEFGFEFSESPRHLEVLGDRLEKWRLTATVQPALLRKHVELDSYTVRVFKPVQVENIEHVGKKSLIDLTTTTGTLLGNGLLTHNSYSTTETYAGVAYDIIIRNTHKYQRAAKRMIESGYWLIATLNGEAAEKISIKFNENKTLHRVHDAQAHQLEIRNVLAKWLMGIINQQQGAQELGYSDVAEEYEWPPAENPPANDNGEVSGEREEGEGTRPSQPPQATQAAFAEFIMNELRDALSETIPTQASDMRQDEDSGNE